MMKICVITCYNQPDYIRAITLRAAATLIDGVEVVTVKNSKTGLLRYPEVFLKALRARFIDKPDVYLLTFRGYEMLLPIRLLSIGKPLIYDEFINPIEWVSYEHKKIGKYNPITGLLWIYYRLLLACANTILTDTESHADLSAEMMKMRRNKFVTLPVGTDETVFKSGKTDKKLDNQFTVFYYGNMLPLHGLKYVIEAATKLKDEPVRFVLIGGSKKVDTDVAEAKRSGANIEYKPWVKFETLPTLMDAADLCLAGPFGNTFQAQYVITGKAYQYMAMGRPTLIGANKESNIFIDEKNVLIAAQGDSQAVADTIRWAMNNRDSLQEIGIAGKQLYYEKFSVANIATKLEGELTSFGFKLGANTESQQKQE